MNLEPILTRIATGETTQADAELIAGVVERAQEFIFQASEFMKSQQWRDVAKEKPEPLHDVLVSVIDPRTDELSVEMAYLSKSGRWLLTAVTEIEIKPHAWKNLAYPITPEVLKVITS